MNHSPGLYYSHPSSLLHDPRVHSPGHPDTPERLQVLERAMAERDWLGWERREAPALQRERLQLVHTPEHVARVEAVCAAGGGALDPDTSVVEASWQAALHAAGGAVEMARALVAGEAEVGFCAMRPAGHHAEAGRAMGFCLFNNVAIAAAAAIADMGVRRVFVLDWDVHAGNGTAEIFRGRSDVLLACIHEDGLYPGTGPLEDAGSGEGEGYTLNLPVPGRSREGLWLALVRELVIPAARAYGPELILVSCGFDAHASDPLSRCKLETDSYARMAAELTASARDLGVPVGVVLEGGYHPGVLAECVSATLPVLAGGPAPAPRSPAPLSEDEEAMLARARAAVGRHWPASAR